MVNERICFELFKSNTCHRLKHLGDIEFITELLQEDRIQYYYYKKWYPECLYLLAMLDYISRENGVPLCTQYEKIRGLKLKDMIFPGSVLAMAEVANAEEVKERAIKESIPEFLRFNIVESDVRNVI